MYDVALLASQTLREVIARDGPSLSQQGIDPGSTLVVGGQAKGEAPRLFLVYPQGNFIEAITDTNYFQIGETKYGKPIIDRVITPASTLVEAEKCLLVSFDSTMRSNLSVGLPIDLLGYETAALRVTLWRRYTESDPYFAQISGFWSTGLMRVFAEVPDVSWS